MSALKPIVARCEAGEMSPAVALMEMLIEAEDEAFVEQALANLASSSSTARTIDALRRAHGPGCARVAAMLRSGADTPPKGASVEEGIAFCARLFDWSVAQSEEASVALYSLGSPALLAEATREIADFFEQNALLARDKAALDVGCGIGRFEEAFAPKLGCMTAIDVSKGMLEVAAKRCGARANVTFAQTPGPTSRPSRIAPSTSSLPSTASPISFSRECRWPRPTSARRRACFDRTAIS
jgi:SAM-dependent methyltransferase